MLDEEGNLLRPRHLTEQDIEEIYAYEANIALFIRCLLRMKASRDPIQAAKGNQLLKRFEEFAETIHDNQEESIAVLDRLLLDTLRNLFSITSRSSLCAIRDWNRFTTPDKRR